MKFKSVITVHMYSYTHVLLILQITVHCTSVNEVDYDFKNAITYGFCSNIHIE